MSNLQNTPIVLTVRLSSIARLYSNFLYDIIEKCKNFKDDYMYDKFVSFLSKADINIKQLQYREHITETELLDELRKYNLKDALIEIAKMCRLIYQNNKSHNINTFGYYDEDFQHYFRCDTLAKLAHLFIKSGTNDFKKKLISKCPHPNLTYLSNFVSNKLESKVEIRQDTMPNHICMLINEQIRYQEDVATKAYRNFALFNNNYGEKFKEITGLTIQEYYNVGLLIFACGCRCKPVLTMEELIQSTKELEIPFVTEMGIMKFLNYLSADYQTYRNMIIKDEKRNVLTIQHKPIIRTKHDKKDVYIIASPMMLMEKIFNGIYFDLEATYSDTTIFKGEFGYIFEQYVGDFIKHYEKEAKIIPEEKLKYTKNGSETKYTDWAVVKNDIAFLIEVKSAIVPLNEIYSETIQVYIKKHIIKAFKQIINKIKDIGKYKELSIFENKDIIPIIVFRDMPPFYNTLFKKELDTVINDLKIFKEYEFLKNQKIVDSIILLGIDDFEAYWINKDKVDIRKIYKAAQENPGKSFKGIMSENKDIIKNNTFLDRHSNEIFPLRSFKKLNY